SSKTQGSITASWNPNTQADGYDLWISTNQSFSKPTKQRIDGSGKGSFEFTGLTSGKKYYVRLRSVKEVESKEWVSQWSTVKEVTVK
ncbi:MAG: fibronectin type III domain-containing protein, partial [Aeriscardovia sp.]|nr:fibronectin type III domain-containing protein [Aeriscardovia sp.]